MIATNIFEVVTEVHQCGAELRISDGKLTCKPMSVVTDAVREKIKPLVPEIAALMRYACMGPDDLPPADCSLQEAIDHLQRATEGLACWENPFLEAESQWNLKEFPTQLEHARHRFERAYTLFESVYDRERQAKVA